MLPKRLHGITRSTVTAGALAASCLAASAAPAQAASPTSSQRGALEAGATASGRGSDRVAWFCPEIDDEVLVSVTSFTPPIGTDKGS